MLSSPSRLESLIPEILELIAFYAGTAVQGASSPDLLSLICTSKSIYGLLANNSHLYSKIFTAKFDIAAVQRRLGDDWTGPVNLKAELQRRCLILRRVKMLEVDNPVNVLINLWTIYLMLLESDGKNDLHLFTDLLVLRYVAAVMSWKDRAVPRHHALHWLEDRQVAGLCLWIIWLSHTRESISLEDMNERHTLNYYVQPFIIAGWKHTSFYAPDTHQYVSPSLISMGFAPTVAGSTPQSCQFFYFGQPLDLVAPCVTPAAMLIAHARYEIGLDVRSRARAAQVAQQALIQQAAILQAPQPQPEALASQTVTAQTLIPPVNVVPVPIAAGVNDRDIAEYEDNVRVIMPARQDWSKPHQELSAANDADWARLTGCFDLGDFDGVKPIQVRDTYTPGTLSGCFFGSLVTPDMHGFSQVLLNPDYPAHQVQWAGRPLFWRLREHHAIGDGPLIPSGMDSQRWGDDVLNAWLPRDVSMMSTPDELVVNTLNEFGERERCTYATYRGGARPYAQRYMDQIQADSEDEDMDEDLEGEYIGNPRNKIRDIIVTGETDGRHGNAWGHYRFVGRIRPWDGLIVLLRIPTRSDDLNHGRWVFRGYMHAGNLVGRWREAHLDDRADRLGYEGAFVMVRSQHDW